MALDLIQLFALIRQLFSDFANTARNKWSISCMRGSGVRDAPMCSLFYLVLFEIHVLQGLLAAIEAVTIIRS